MGPRKLTSASTWAWAVSASAHRDQGLIWASSPGEKQTRQVTFPDRIENTQLNINFKQTMSDFFKFHYVLCNIGNVLQVCNIWDVLILSNHLLFI